MKNGHWLPLGILVVAGALFLFVKEVSFYWVKSAKGTVGLEASLKQGEQSLG